MKKKTKGILIGLVALGVIGMFMSAEEETASQKPKQEEVQEVVMSEVENVSTEEKEEVDLSKVVKMKDIAWAVETSMRDNFDYVNVTYDEELKSVHLDVTNNGMSSVIVGTTLGVVEKTEWKKVTDAIDDYCLSTLESAKENFNIQDLNISFSLLNDENKERIFYMSMNGKTVYDCLSE